MPKKKSNDNKMPPEVYQEMMKWYPTRFDAFDLHHALITKGDIKGMSKIERRKIHDPRNLWWVRHSDHASHANLLTKQQYYRLLCDRFGTEEVDAFIKSFNWKQKPPFTLAWLKGE